MGEHEPRDGIEFVGAADIAGMRPEPERLSADALPYGAEQILALPQDHLDAAPSVSETTTQASRMAAGEALSESNCHAKMNRKVLLTARIVDLPGRLQLGQQAINSRTSKPAPRQIRPA